MTAQFTGTDDGLAITVAGTTILLTAGDTARLAARLSGWNERTAANCPCSPAKARLQRYVKPATAR